MDEHDQMNERMAEVYEQQRSERAACKETAPAPQPSRRPSRERREPIPYYVYT